MVHDSLLPSVFYKTHFRFKNPWLSTTFITVIVAIMETFPSADFLDEMTSVGTLCAFFFIKFGVTNSRITNLTRPKCFRVPLGPYATPLLGSALCIFLITTSAPTAIYRLFSWICIGLIVYLCYIRCWVKVNNPKKQGKYQSHDTSSNYFLTTTYQITNKKF